MLAYLSVAVCLLCVWWWRRHRENCINWIPCPKGYPVIGNLLDATSDNRHLLFTAWSKELGGIFKVKVFGKETVVVSSYEVLHELLVTKGKDFAGRPYSYRQFLISANFRDLKNSPPNAVWALIRKTVHRSLKLYDSGLKRVEDNTNDVLIEMIKSFQDHNGKPFQSKHTIFIVMLSNILLFTLGRKYSNEDEDFQLFIKTILHGIQFVQTSGKGAELETFPWLRFFGNEAYNVIKRVLKQKDEMYAKVKDQAQGDLEMTQDDAPRGVLHDLLELYTKQNQSPKTNSGVIFEEEHVKQSTLSIIIAGILTTSSSFYAFLNLLIWYPEVQRKLQEEVDSVVGSDHTVCLQDRGNMPYTQATVFELLRYTSVLPLGLPHKSICNSSLGGKTIPAGTTVLTNLYALHHDEEFWEKPYEFLPERFLDENGELLSPSSDERKHLMPFGAGPRVCVGEILALSRLFLLIATISKMFDVEAGPQKVSCDSRKYISGVVLLQEDFELVVNCREN